MPQRIDHKKFLELGDRIDKARKGQHFDTFLLLASEIDTVLEHVAWLKEFIAQRRRAARANTNPGRKPLPSSEIQPASLARREKRRAGRG